MHSMKKIRLSISLSTLLHTNYLTIKLKPLCSVKVRKTAFPSVGLSRSLAGSLMMGEMRKFVQKMKKEKGLLRRRRRRRNSIGCLLP